MSNITPNRTLLNIYAPNRIRLGKLHFPLTMTLTRWINEAISEKLDRCENMEDPPVSAVPPAPAVPAFDPMAERKRRLRLSRGRAYVGPYTIRARDGNRTEYWMAVDKDKKMGDGSPGIEAILEDLYEASGETLSTEEQGEIMAAHVRKQKQMADGAAKVQRAEAQELKGAPAMEETPEISPHAAIYAKFEASQLAKHGAQVVEDPPTAKIAEDQEEDFWGDEEDAAYHKIKAMARKS